MAADIYVSSLLDVYGPILSDKQFRILDGYYNNDLSLSEIAENEGITRQGVSDFVKRAEIQLNEFEEKLHYHEKMQALKASASAVREDNEKINELLDIIDNL